MPSRSRLVIVTNLWLACLRMGKLRHREVVCSRSCSWWLVESGLGPGPAGLQTPWCVLLLSSLCRSFRLIFKLFSKVLLTLGWPGTVNKNEGPATLICRTRCKQAYFRGFLSMLYNFLFLTFQICFLLEYSCFTVLVSTVQQSESATRLHRSPLFWFHSHSGPHRARSRVPWAIR